jgi:putative heme degradation protein
MTKQAHSTRKVKPKRPSQLERDLRASIQIAKLQLRVSNLEAAVLKLQNSEDCR